MRTRPTLLTLIFFTASIILSGCLDVEQHYTLNPDGSGKVSIDADLTDWTLDASDKDIKEKLRERVKDFIDSTKGIDAWKDVSYTMNEDKVHFQGTAYFPDITKVESKDLGLAKIVITPLPGGEKAFSMDMESRSNFEATSSSSEGEGEATPPDTSEQRISEQIDSLRSVYGMMKEMMGMVLTNLRLSMSVDLPGTPREVTGFTKTSNGELAFTIEGMKIIQAMDSVMSDSTFLRQQLLSPDKAMDDSMKKLFFPQGELRAIIPADAPVQFDYKAELAAARPDYAKLMKDLNTKKPAKKKSTKGTRQYKL